MSSQCAIVTRGLFHGPSPPSSRRPLPPNARLPRPAPTLPPRGRARGARPAASSDARPRGRAPRSARGVAALRRLRSCLHRTRSGVTCLCRLCAVFSALGGCPKRVVPGRTRAKAEDRLVQRLDERAPVAVHDDLDKCPPHHVGAGRVVPQLPEQLATVARRLPEQHRGSDARGPETVRAAEQRSERFAELLGAEGIALEQREFPPIERLAELVILVG